MKKNIRFNIIALMLLGSVSTVFSQQLPQFTQYMFNMISINPAYAGSRETLSIVGLHRSQWIGLNGAPTTQTLSIHSPLKNENIGLGLSFVKDKLGFENFSYLYADFSYTINLSREVQLAFGLKGGFTSFILDQEIRDAAPNDPIISSIENKWSPNIGAGLFLHSNRWYAGLSAPRILEPDYTGSDNFDALERVSYYFTGGVVLDVNNNTKFKPSFLVKTTSGAPLSYDLTANFLFNEKLWLGAAYRFNESAGAFGAILDFQVSKQLRIGYSYEHPTSDISPFGNGTHEILLIFEFSKNEQVRSPRYF